MWEWIRTADGADLIFYGLMTALILGEVILRFILRVAKGNVVLEYVDSGFIAIMLALVIRTFVIQSFKIPSESMRNTLLIGDQLLVSKYAYGLHIPFKDGFVWRFGEPKRGEVVVFKYPKNPRRDFIKRCVGVPGDRIEVRDKVLYVNGVAQDERYVIHGDERMIPRDSGIARDSFGPITVPPDHYFMMGDNRDFSADSRFWGLLPRNLIEGKALVIYWPLTRWKLIK